MSNLQLLTLLATAGGHATSRALQQRLGVSQATISRQLSELIRAGQVVRVGAARAQLYLLPRGIAGLPQRLPLFAIDTHGTATPFASLIPLAGGASCVVEPDGSYRLYAGIPWFVQDMQPQGFLGRAFARAHQHIGLNANPREWTDDECLRALAIRGEDVSGNLIVGDESFARFQTQTASPSHISPTDYAACAEAAIAGAPPGSSAGGEQPKFCAALADGRHVIVKFSPAISTGGDAVAARIRDLLIAEHYALSLLATAGVAAAESRFSEAAGRAFLEVTRFDRTPQGRIGMVSLAAFDAEYIGEMDSWDKTAIRLAQRELLPADDIETLCLLEAFGRLIANSDRHYGNIALIRADSRWRLAPAYDMLPMLFFPVSGEVVARSFRMSELHPTSQTLNVWPRALALAQTFWQRVAADERVSVAFRAIAQVAM
jgi:HipA-like C-terminal domain/Winged helix-turn-helix DNA-binding